MGYLSCKADSAISVSSPSPSSPTIQRFHYSDLEAATNGFSDQKLLGKGSHGSVYKAVLRGGRRVAVKKPSRGVELNQEADNEMEILSKIRSPGLVNLVGYAHNDAKDDRLLVVEFMSNGTLYDVLHSGGSGSSSSRSLLNWGRRVRLAVQIAKAVETLHSQNPPIVHRDIKSANVLIDRSFNARLGDFGLALRCGGDDDYRLRSTPPAGTMGYLDPCYVTPDNLSTKTDVFSFGILLLEILSGRKAIDVGHSPPCVVDWAIPLIKKGKFGAVFDPRVPELKDPVVRKQLALVASKCVRSCRERRPSMKEVVEWLTALSKLVPLHSWNGFNNPCMMVETVGRPVELRTGSHLGSRVAKSVSGDGLEVADGQFSRQSVKDSRRVYSDLGYRSNLIDLMSGAGVGSGSIAENSVYGPRHISSTRISRFARNVYGPKSSNSVASEGSRDRTLFGLSSNQSVAVVVKGTE